MKTVVDTNVIAYLLLQSPEHEEEMREFWAGAHEALAPALWEAELVNVVSMSIRAGVLLPADGRAKLSLARRLGIHTVPTRSLWQGALLRSIETGVSAYDTLFVELAARECVRLVTFDKRLTKTWPELACRPSELR